MSDITSSAGKYVYCIIRGAEPREFRTKGIGDPPSVVHNVSFDGLAAVVSDSPCREYERDRRNMMAHAHVLDEVMQEFTILPVRFGTVAPSERAIREKVLKRRYSEMDDLLREMEGRKELGVKAFWRQDGVFREIVEETPAIRHLRDRLKGVPPNESYYDRIKLGEMVHAAVVKKRDLDAERIVARLRPLSCRTKVNKALTDRTVLDSAFLVEQSRQSDFEHALAQLDAEMGSRIIFKYVDRAPPYNFVNLVINWNE